MITFASCRIAASRKFYGHGTKSPFLIRLRRSSIARTQNRLHSIRLLGSRHDASINNTRYRYLSTASWDVEEGRTIEEQYSKKTPLEHVLLRPGMYVGPVGRLPPNTAWLLEPTPEPYVNTNEKQVPKPVNPYRMVQKECGFIPALIKIFDEILVNASDNKLRDPKGCTKIDVKIDPGSYERDPVIQIWNNGKGIPVQIHKEENMYLPEMLFGHLLTGSNFDDNQKRLTGGRHGYGAKLTNIFSKSFTVETLDSTKGLLYRQTWFDNMMRSSEPMLSNVDSSQGDYTCVTFVPDIPRLTDSNDAKFIELEDYLYMCRRVIDVAGCSSGNLQVYLNGQDVSIASFSDYTNMYRGEDSPKMCFNRINSRWTVGVGLSTGHSFDSVSFVNGMATPRGGTHVNAIVSQVVKKIQDTVSKMEPGLSDILAPGLIRRNLFISCNALIENPGFDSQMKEYLTSNPSSFGSSYTLSDAYLNEIVKTEDEGGPGIVEEVIRIAKGRQQANLFKMVGGKQSKRQLLSIPKLEDAHRAGSSKSDQCTLILTEGDSAKALAVAGLEVIGRETYGVFPLRGKFLNVRHATVDQLAKNAEVKALIAILGLDFDKEYDTTEEREGLRYGHVMLMTDQDTDGSHIKGLVINFFRHFWPKLLKPTVDSPTNKQFLSSFVTPLLKATSKNKKEILSFYSMADYDAWRNSFESDSEFKKWSVKYYKGLGTSTPAEAKAYFSEFDKHHRPFIWSSERDGELLDKVFDKSRAADRREWISTEYDPTATIDEDDVTFCDFVNKEMIHFSSADNIRSLPNVVDGLKPSQRKVLYACFKRKLKSEVKVAQLSGYCAEHTAYHHGEASLQSTSQFGTRLVGGADAASPRYIFTYLSPLARYLFPEDDDALLEYLEDDGQMIEPKYFCPIIPLLLVNGSQGIGTGWSTYIPPHNPLGVLDYIRSKLDGQDYVTELRPYARGFKGSIENKPTGNGYISFGKAERLGPKKVLINELPIGVWTNKYKEHLLRMQSKGIIDFFIENHTTTDVSFIVNLKPSQLDRMEQKGLENAFRLVSNLNIGNMNAFDADGTIRKFHTAEEIADAFFPIRLSLYDDRKSVLLANMKYSASVMKNKARFIQMVSEGQIDLIGGRVSKQDTYNFLRNHGFNTKMDLEAIKFKKAGDAEAGLNEHLEETQTNDPDSFNDFDYLLKMPLSSLTAEKIHDLTVEAGKTESELNNVIQSTPEDLWMTDLDRLASYLQNHS